MFVWWGAGAQGVWGYGEGGDIWDRAEARVPGLVRHDLRWGPLELCTVPAGGGWYHGAVLAVGVGPASGFRLS